MRPRRGRPIWWSGSSTRIARISSGVVDLTYIRTWVGFAYLALVTDVFSGRILGWALAMHMRTDLPLEALEMAIWTRKRQGIDDLSGLIHDGDRGSPYLSIRYTER